MKKMIKISALGILLATANLNAFEIRTGVMSIDGAAGQYSSNPDKRLYDSKNVLLEIGHYKNSDHEGFGFGWRLGGSYAVSNDYWYQGSTAEWGFAIGYSLIRDLDLKGEFGLGFNAVSKSYAALTTYFGVGLDYAIAGHYIVGVSVKKYIGFADTDSPSSNGYTYAPVATSLYLGYRF